MPGLAPPAHDRRRRHRSRPEAWGVIATTTARLLCNCYGSAALLLMSSSPAAFPTTSPTAACTPLPLQAAFAFQQPLLVGPRRHALVTPQCCRAHHAHSRSRSHGLLLQAPSSPFGDEPLPAPPPPVKRGRGRPRGSTSTTSTQAQASSGRGRGRGRSRSPLSQEFDRAGRGRGNGGPGCLDTNDDGGGGGSDGARREPRELETFAEILKSDEKDDSSRTRAVRRTLEGLESFADRLNRDDLGPNGGAALRRRLEEHVDDYNDRNDEHDDDDDNDVEGDSSSNVVGAGAGAGAGGTERARLMQRLLREEEADRRAFMAHRLANRDRRRLLQEEEEEQQELVGVDRRRPFDEEGGDAGPQLNAAAAAAAATADADAGGGLLGEGAAGEAASSRGTVASARDTEFGHGLDQDMDMDMDMDTDTMNIDTMTTMDMDMMNIDTEELPSALTLLANLDVLASLDIEATDVRLPFPQVEEDEETTRLMQMSDQDLLHNPELRQVMVVIGKHLVRDQVTVEYASRIRRLVQGLKSGRLQPDLVCFTGGRVRDNKVADASAGYVFFRHLCEQHKVDTCNIGFLVESESTCTKEAMMNVVREVSRLEREERQGMEEEERPRTWPRQKYHFTLISNEYHLSRVIMVHKTSESVSLLAPLKQLEASWGYEHVPYPYACYDDDTKKFQADVYKTLEELVPLQVNVQAVASREEFFQEENYASLAHVRERLAEFIQQIHSSRGPRARNMNLVDLQRAAEQGRRGKLGTFPAGNVSNMRLDEALEWAAGALAKIQEIIEPAATRRNSVSLRAWAMCAALIERGILQAQMAADPDRPLTPGEWGVLEDESPPRDPKDDEVVASLARERIHTLFDRRGDTRDAGARGFSSRKKVSHWVGANAWSDIADPDDMLGVQPARSIGEDSGVQTEEGAIQQGGGIDEEVEVAADLFGDHGIVSPTAAGRGGGGGSFEIEYKEGGGTNLWEGGGGEAGAVGQRARATKLTEVVGAGVGGVRNDDVSRLERDTVEAEDNTDNDGDVDEGGHKDGDASQLEGDLDNQERTQQPRVNWALPRPQRRRKSVRPNQPQPPAPPQPPTPLPVVQKLVEPKSPGRPKVNGAKQSGIKVRTSNVRVNGARATPSAAAKPPVKPPAKPDTPAPATRAKRGRGRPRLARAPPQAAVAARDGDDG